MSRKGEPHDDVGTSSTGVSSSSSPSSSHHHNDGSDDGRMKDVELNGSSPMSSNASNNKRLEGPTCFGSIFNSANSPMLWLIIWTLNNVGVTLLNKAAFATVDFRYPYFLSAIHMALNGLGAQFIFWSLERRRNHDDANSKGLSSSVSESWVTKLLGNLQRQTLDANGRRLILAFSFIFSLNIAIGNVSLKYVSVNFNQVMRSLVPAITIAMGMAMGRPVSVKRQVAVLPVIVGVAMACFGDMSYSTLGFIYTVACIILAALKVVASGEMLTGSLKLHPVDLLGHMAPLALVQCLCISFVNGEISSIAARWENELSPFVNLYPFAVVIGSGLASFTLNISSLQANKLTSPLTLCIAANVKQVLMIAVSTILFNIEISPLNGAGIVVVLIGSARYSYVSVMEKQPSNNKDSSTGLKVNASDVEKGDDDVVGDGIRKLETVELIPKAAPLRSVSQSRVQRTASSKK
ncbi:hypothetical protein ACA910_005635 [Epithemia clementina (nom. ined.)]